MTRWAYCAKCSARVLDAAYYSRKGFALPVLLEASAEGKYRVERIVAGTPIIAKGTEFRKHQCRKAA